MYTYIYLSISEYLNSGCTWKYMSNTYNYMYVYTYIYMSV